MPIDTRPHGEHPTLGQCDCDECQAFDRMDKYDHDFEDFEKVAEGVYKCRKCGMVEDYRKE